MRRIRVLALLCIACALPALVQAAGLGFLKNSPIYYFTDADLKLMNKAALEVLNAADSAAVREWKNPRTGYGGKVQGLGSFRTTDGLDCRKLRIWNQAKGLESDSIYPVCRQGTGEWRLASGKELLPVEGSG